MDKQVGDFNSRPSARGDVGRALQADARHISIHAPPRGATQRARHGVSGLVISIHAPPRGATGVGSGVLGSAGVFQFTPLREGRPKGFIMLSPHITISIHAPPRGATSAVPAPLKSISPFQFTPLREGRPEVSTSVSKPSAFQFTPLREGRPAFCVAFRVASTYFNSRPSARGDPPFVSSVVWSKFQFTPLREGRP